MKVALLWLVVGCDGYACDLAKQYVLDKGDVFDVFNLSHTTR